MRGWKVVSRLDETTFMSRFARNFEHVRYYGLGVQTVSEFRPMFFFSYALTGQHLVAWGVGRAHPAVLLHVEASEPVLPIELVANAEEYFDAYWQAVRATTSWDPERAFAAPPHSHASERITPLAVVYEGMIGLDSAAALDAAMAQAREIKTDKSIFFPIATG